MSSVHLKAPQFKYAPFSRKQLQVLSWWLDPRAKQFGNLSEVKKKHPEWLNRSDKEVLIADGSIRAGKTLIMSMSYIEWSMTNYSNEQFGIAGKTIGSLRRNVITPLKRMLAGRKGYRVKDRRADNLLDITYNGITNHYYLFGGKDEGSQDLVQGLTAAGFFFDEVALMPKSFVNQATGRVSVDGGKLWFNCNPAGPYHWFKTEWIDKLKDHKAIHIHFTMADNPSLAESVKDRYRRTYSGVFYQRYILGEWVLSDGIVYDNFNKDTMVATPPKGVAEKYYVSVDYGTQNPTVFLLWGRFNGIWWCLKEYYYDGRHSSRQKTDEQYANDFLEFVGKLKVKAIVDPSAASFIAQLRAKGVSVEKAKNDVLDGIRETQSAMNLGKIMFAPGLVNLFKELASYAWDPKAAEHGEDKVIKQHDHACDGVRYFVYRVVRTGGVVKPKVKPKAFR